MLGSTTICPKTILFLLYNVDLIRLIERHGLHPQEYADDKHIHGSCRPMETQSLMERLGTCISDVAGWISSNCLQLNTAKNRSTLVRFLSPAAPHPECPLRVCADNIKPGKYVCDVEIYIDSDMSMKAHVSRTVSRCFASLRHIRSIRLSPF